MKTISYCALFILLFSACDNMTVNTGPGSENKIKGSGNVTKVSHEIMPFNKIESEGVFNLILDQGSVEALKVETDDNLQQMIVSEVRDSVLILKMKDSMSYSRSTKMNVYITLKDITRLKTESVGTTSCANTLHLKNLDVKCAGVGATSLDLDVEVVRIDADLVGGLQLKGRARDAHIEHDGIGAIEAYGFETENLELEANGVGGAQVFASNSLKVKANGVGAVKYKGNPKTKSVDGNRIGKVSEGN